MTRPYLAHARTTRRRPALVATLAAIAGSSLLPACIVFQPEPTGSSSTRPEPSPQPGQITMAELDGLTKAYADRYMTLIVAACDDIIADNPSLEQRRLANLFKTASVTAIYDVATNPDPFTQLIDMLLVVTLQSMVWIDEDTASLTFPDRSETLVLAIRRAREDIWELATRAMTPRQLDDLDRLMVEWRRENNEIQFVSFVRFGDFAERRGRSIISEVRSGGGLLAPAKQAIDETRLLAERIFYISKRAPFVLSWQVQAIADDLLIKPEVSGALAQIDQIAAAVDRTASVAEGLPALITDERKAIFAEIDQREAALSNTFDQYRLAIADTRTLVADLNTTMNTTGAVFGDARQTIDAIDRTIGTLDSFMERHAANKAEAAQTTDEPFDIEQYSLVARELSTAIRELNVLVASTGQLIDSQAWNVRLDELSRATSERMNQAESHGVSLVNLAFLRAAVLAFIIFVLAVGYRIIATFVQSRAARTLRASTPPPAST